MSTPKKVTELTESTSPQLTHYIPVHDGTGLKKVLLSYIKALMGSAAATWGSITGTLSNQTDLQNALNAKQNSLGFTPEDSANKKLSLTDNSDTYYPSQKAVKTAVDAKQDTLVSGTNIKTINNTSLLGSGDISIAGASSIALGSTPATGGTDKHLLYNDNNKVNEIPSMRYDKYTDRLEIYTASFAYYSVLGFTRILTYSYANSLGYCPAIHNYYGGNFAVGSMGGYSVCLDNGMTTGAVLKDLKFGIGILNPDTRLHVIDTADQVRVGANTTNYLSINVGATGLVTYDAVGSGAKFKFMQPINLQNIPTSATGLSTGDIWNDSGTLKIV